MFFYIVLTPISTTSAVYEILAIRVNTSKSTYTFTSVFILTAVFSLSSVILLVLSNFCYVLDRNSLAGLRNY